MAVKSFDIQGIGSVLVKKRRGSKSMRIKLAQDGTITVSVPNWVPYRVAIDFALKQSVWIKKHQPPKKYISHGQRIGRSHTINFSKTAMNSPMVKINGLYINILMPNNLDTTDALVQKTAVRGARNALKKQAFYLEDELNYHADRLGYEYKSLSFKFMKSKWGSCSNTKHITLNYRLLDLPMHLSEYVLIHELVHLNHMNHSSAYWEELEVHIPDYKFRKTELRKLQLDW